MKKQYLKTRPVCKVTFALPKEAILDAKVIDLVGDFNGWKVGATPLKKRKDGSFAATVELDSGREYQFRYVVDRESWVNGGDADRYTPSPVSEEENGIVDV